MITDTHQEAPRTGPPAGLVETPTADPRIHLVISPGESEEDDEIVQFVPVQAS